jgi:hypothetical protein
MGDIANRLERLEARTPPPDPVRPGRVTLAEIRALEERIKRQEAGEVRPAPEADFTRGVEPDDRVAAVVREIERLERLDQVDGKDRNG